MNPKLLIVTDLGVLKAYQLNITPRGSLHLDRLETVVLDEAHCCLVDRVTDLAGRRVAPTRKSRGAPIAADHNLKLETKRRLIKKIAGHIERLVAENRDCSVRLAAHREINHLILSLLPPAVRQRIETNLVLDLVHADERRLIKCFAPQRS
jgi:Protein required for attachment to host cells